MPAIRSVEMQVRTLNICAGSRSKAEYGLEPIDELVSLLQSAALSHKPKKDNQVLNRLLIDHN